MVSAAETIQGIIVDFVHRLEEHAGIQVQAVILYGSYAQGCSHENSDIDLAIISDGFQDRTPLERIDMMVPVLARCDARLEPLAFTLEEYHSATRLDFLGEIKRTGRVVYDAASARS